MRYFTNLVEMIILTNSSLFGCQLPEAISTPYLTKVKLSLLRELWKIPMHTRDPSEPQTFLKTGDPGEGNIY